jgi:hypothetical protein
MWRRCYHRIVVGHSLPLARQLPACHPHNALVRPPTCRAVAQERYRRLQRTPVFSLFGLVCTVAQLAAHDPKESADTAAAMVPFFERMLQEHREQVDACLRAGVTKHAPFPEAPARKGSAKKPAGRMAAAAHGSGAALQQKLARAVFRWKRNREKGKSGGEVLAAPAVTVAGDGPATGDGGGSTTAAVAASSSGVASAVAAATTLSPDGDEAMPPQYGSDDGPADGGELGHGDEDGDEDDGDVDDGEGDDDGDGGESDGGIELQVDLEMEPGDDVVSNGVDAIAVAEGGDPERHPAGGSSAASHPDGSGGIDAAASAEDAAQKLQLGSGGGGRMGGVRMRGSGLEDTSPLKGVRCLECNQYCYLGMVTCERCLVTARSAAALRRNLASSAKMDAWDEQSRSLVPSLPCMCLTHAGAEMACGHPVNDRRVRLRHTDAELLSILDALKARAASGNKWRGKVRAALARVKSHQAWVASRCVAGAAKATAAAGALPTAVVTDGGVGAGGSSSVDAPAGGGGTSAATAVVGAVVSPSGASGGGVIASAGGGGGGGGCSGDGASPGASDAAALDMVRPTLRRLQSLARKGAALRMPAMEMRPLENVIARACQWAERATARLPRRRNTRTVKVSCSTAPSRVVSTSTSCPPSPRRCVVFAVCESLRGCSLGLCVCVAAGRRRLRHLARRHLGAAERRHVHRRAGGGGDDAAGGARGRRAAVAAAGARGARRLHAVQQTVAARRRRRRPCRSAAAGAAACWQLCSVGVGVGV